MNYDMHGTDLVLNNTLTPVDNGDPLPTTEREGYDSPLFGSLTLRYCIVSFMIRFPSAGYDSPLSGSWTLGYCIVSFVIRFPSPTPELMVDDGRYISLMIGF